MEEWKEYRLGEIATFITAKSDISLFNKRNYISTENILPNRSGIKEASSLPTTGSVIAFCKNDILISNIRPYFKKIWLASFDGGCSNDVICLRAKENVSCQFLYYLLSQDAFFDYVMLGAKGTKMPRGDRNQIIKWVLTLPPLKEQHRIVSLLYSLDSKIELNRKINSNLEEQAKALFKSWFIDFEPFKDGKFVDSEFGMIPERWNMMSFESFISESQDKAMVGTYPAYSVTNNGITPRTEKFKKQLSKATSKEKILRKNDLVFGMSRQILNWGIMQDEIGSVSSAYHVYKIDKERTCPTYLRYFIKGYESYFRDLIGTAAREGQSLDKGALMNKKLLVPSKEILRSFIQHVTTIENTITLFKSQCRRLATLRDTLLPRLMSGEIEVRS